MSMFLTGCLLVCFLVMICRDARGESVVTYFAATQVSCNSANLSWIVNNNLSDSLSLFQLLNSTNVTISTSLTGSYYLATNLTTEALYTWTIQLSNATSDRSFDSSSINLTLVTGLFHLSILDNSATVARLKLTTNDSVEMISATIYYKRYNDWNDNSTQFQQVDVSSNGTVLLTPLSSYVRYQAKASVNTACNTNITTSPFEWTSAASSPTKPNMTDVSANVNNVTIKWQESEFNGNKSNYMISCSGLNDTKNGSTTNTSFFFDSLLPAIVYTCSITASNVQNFSATEVFNFTTLAQRTNSAVANVNFHSVLNKSDELSLEFPFDQSFRLNDSNGNPIGYLLQLFYLGNQSCLYQVCLNAENLTLPFNQSLLQNDLARTNFYNATSICPTNPPVSTNSSYNGSQYYSITFKNLTAATQYNVSLYVINKAGPGPNFSYTTNTFDALASSPRNVSLNINETVVTIKWESPSSPNTFHTPFKYLVQVDNSSEVYVNATNYTILNIIPCATVKVRVCLVNEAGYGTWSDFINATTPPSRPSDAVTINVTSVTSRSQFLSWNDVKVGQCTISYSLNRTGSADNAWRVFNTSNTFYNVTDLEPYSSYLYSIQTLVSNGKDKPVVTDWSSWTSRQSTDEEVLLPVKNLSCLQVTNFLRNLQCNWLEPSNPYGQILNYTGQINQSDTLVVNLTKTSLIFKDLNVPLYVSVKIFGVSKLGPGKAEVWNGFLNAGEPKINSCESGTCLNDTSGCAISPSNYDTSTQFRIVLPLYAFGLENGLISSYQLLISQGSSFYPNRSAFNTSWSKSGDAYSIDIDLTALSICNQTSSTSRRRRDTSTNTDNRKMIYTLGSQSAEECEKKPKNCNGPLKPSAQYYVALRGYTGNGKSATIGPFAFKTSSVPPPPPTPISVGIIVGVLCGILAIGIIIGFLFIKKRINTPKLSEEGSLTSGSSDNPQIPRPSLSIQLANSFRNSSFRRLFGSISKPTTRRPIPVASLKDAYRVGCCDGDRGFHQQYQELCKYSASIRKYLRHEFDRYCDIGTVPRSEDIAGVKLRPILIKCEEANMDGLSLGGDGMAYPPTEYINATYIPNRNNPQWIATQGPLPTTVSHFWWLVWQENPWIILMLTGMKEKMITKCEAYFPGSDINKEPESMEFPLKNALQESLGDLRMCVEMIDCQEIRNTEYGEPNYVQRTFRITVGEESRNVLHLQFSRWVDHSGTEIHSLQHLFSGFCGLRAIDPSHRSRPVVIHCSAGVGRTGTFIAISKLVDELQSGANEIDIFGTVRELRTVRTCMVQTESQLKLIYEFLLKFQESKEETTYENVNWFSSGMSNTNDNVITMTHHNPVYQLEPAV